MDALMGNVDPQIDLNMENEGSKIEMLKPGTGKQQTQMNTWKELFGGDF